MYMAELPLEAKKSFLRREIKIFSRVMGIPEPELNFDYPNRSISGFQAGYFPSSNTVRFEERILAAMTPAELRFFLLHEMAHAEQASRGETDFRNEISFRLGADLHALARSRRCEIRADLRALELGIAEADALSGLEKGRLAEGHFWEENRSRNSHPSTAMRMQCIRIEAERLRSGTAKRRQPLPPWRSVSLEAR